MCALWLQENKQMHSYIESSSSNKTIHSTQYNTSQSPPQLTTISLVLSIHTQYIIITPDNKITPIAVCAVQRRDDSHNNKSIQQRRPPINSDHHNTRPGMNALLTRQIIIIKSHIITKPDCNKISQPHNNHTHK